MSLKEQEVDQFDSVVPEVEDGEKTTEFWITTAVSLMSGVIAMLSLFGYVSVDMGDKLVLIISGLIGSIIPAIVYTLQRGKVKAERLRAVSTMRLLAMRG